MSIGGGMGGSRWRIALLVAVVILMSAFAAVVVSHLLTEAPTVTVHDPIRIDGNDEFTSENGITGGTGTEEDPYVLEWWHINSTDTPGICISNSTVWLVMRHVVVEGGSPDAVGILLESCSNITVSCCVSTGNRIGILLEASRNMTVADSEFNGNLYWGIGVWCHPARSDSNISIVGNTIQDNGGYGITCEGSGGTGVTISRNQISENVSGIKIHWLRGSVISQNVITNPSGGRGIEIACSSNLTVSNNTVHCEASSGEGIVLLEGTGGRDIYVLGNDIANWRSGITVTFLSDTPSATIMNNTISGNREGVNILGGISSVIGNSFFNNEVQAAIGDVTEIFTQTTVKWNGTYPAGGNYWDNYTGIDMFSGPLQIEPGDDDIGDTPFVIDENNTDFYPLIRPVTNVSAESVAFLIVEPWTGDFASLFEFNAPGSRWPSAAATDYAVSIFTVAVSSASTPRTDR